GSSSGNTPLFAFSVSLITPLTTVSASPLSKYCMTFSVDSTLLAAMKSCAFCRFSLGLSKNDFLAASLLKQYTLSSLSVQVSAQLVITCRPCARPCVHCPPNCACDAGNALSAA